MNKITSLIIATFKSGKEITLITERIEGIYGDEKDLERMSGGYEL